MKKIPTGIRGLDEMLGGGFPSCRIILVHGGPGSGKTIFSFQFLMNGLENKERGVYVSLEEPLNLIKANVLSLRWDLEKFEKEGSLKMINGSQIVYAEKESRGSTPVISEFSDKIEQVVKTFEAKRLAIDPITSAVIHQPFRDKKRREIGRLFKTLRRLSCTSVITSEWSSGGEEFYMEEYLADGVIVLSKTLQNFKMIKTVRIEKMRGIRHDDQPRRYEISSDKGFIIYNTEPVTVE
ncbi:MAG: RAD55 family ATPase [Candidatus Bathyarchaeia archaeon]